jgi:hypothetical protein
LNGTSASVTEFKLMVAFMIPLGGHGGDQEPRLQLGPSVSGSSSWDSWTKLIIERLQPALGASPGWSSVWANNSIQDLAAQVVPRSWRVRVPDIAADQGIRPGRRPFGTGRYHPVPGGCAHRARVT